MGGGGSGSCRVVVFCNFVVFARSIVKTGDFGTNNSYVARRFWPSSLRMIGNVSVQQYYIMLLLSMVL